MLDPTKEYCLRVKIGEQWKTMVSAKLNDKGNVGVSFSPEFGKLLNEPKWVNLSLSVYDKKEHSAHNVAKQNAYQPEPDYTEVPF